MALALLIAGIFAVVAGLLAILFGIPVKEFSFGNTLIIVGAIGVCSGLLLMGLFVVVVELKNIARRLGATMPSEVRVRPVLPPGMTTTGVPAPEAVSTEPMKLEPTLPPSVAAPPPWQDEAATREKQRGEAPAPEAAEPPRRRNLLFASTSRKERERAQAKGGETLPPEQPIVPEAAEAPPASFEDAWPKPERMRPLEAAAPRRPTPPRTPSTFAEPAAPAAPAPEARPPTPPAEQPAVTVLKSGVVDGMAYSLYSDGSIEAQMPEGMMRFASIDELRSHLDQRS
jgi:hypothetical protein